MGRKRSFDTSKASSDWKTYSFIFVDLDRIANLGNIKPTKIKVIRSCKVPRTIKNMELSMPGSLPKVINSCKALIPKKADSRQKRPKIVKKIAPFSFDHS